jgi:predicted nucleic acid-binding protein
VIVVDTNVLIHYWIPGPMTAAALALWRRDPEWVAPPLWRSEFRNVLATLCRAHRLTPAAAIEAVRQAEDQMSRAETEVGSVGILALAFESGRSAYDCEYVALAKELGVPLITCDRQLVRTFPAVARNLEVAATGLE